MRPEKWKTGAMSTVCLISNTYDPRGEGGPEATEKLKSIAEDLDADYDADASPLELVEMIRWRPNGMKTGTSLLPLSR